MANNGRLLFDPSKPEDLARHQELLDLRLKEKWSLMHIAQHFGISIPTVQAWLQRPIGFLPLERGRRKKTAK
jgi:transposase